MKNLACLLWVSIPMLGTCPVFAQNVGPYEVTEMLGGEITCGSESLTEGFGFSLEASASSFLIGSYHTWDDVPEPKSWKMMGRSQVIDAGTLSSRTRRPLVNSIANCDEGKGYGYAGALIGDINADGVEDVAMGIPFTGLSELQILSSKKEEKNIQYEIDQRFFSDPNRVVKTIDDADWFGRSVQFIPGKGKGKVVATAPSFSNGRAYVYSLDTRKLLFQTEPSSSKVEDRNGYESKLTPDLDGDQEMDFALVPAYQNRKREPMEVPGQVHFYSSQNGKRLLSLRLDEPSSRTVTTVRFLDDVDQDGYTEIAVGFAYSSHQHKTEGYLKYAGRILVLKGKRFHEKMGASSAEETVLNILPEDILLDRRGEGAFALLGDEIQNWIDLNHDGIREFIVSEMGYGQLDLKMPMSGRAIVFDGKTLQRLPEYEILGTSSFGFFPKRIAVIPELRMMALSSPFHDAGKGIVKFYKMKP